MSAKRPPRASPPSNSSAGASLVKTSPQRAKGPDLPVLVPVWRGSSSVSSKNWRREPLSSRTALPVGGNGCHNCGAPYTTEGLPACLYECPPARLAHPIGEPAAFSWPTPTASSYGSNRGGANPGPPQMGLEGLARSGLLPSPIARDSRKTPSARKREGGASLSEKAGGPLHPDFVEWMMGFAPGWTDIDCTPSVTPWSLKRRTSSRTRSGPSVGPRKETK